MEFDQSVIAVSQTGETDPAVVPAQIAPVTKQSIVIYLDSAEPPSFDEESDVCPFDIKLTVEHRCDDGTSKSYKITKRIAFDKVKLFQQAVAAQPEVTIVEDEAVAAEKRLTEELKKYKERMKRLAGV